MTEHAVTISERGLEFITRFEGCVLHPYDDGGKPGVGNSTIGVGHLIHMGPTTAADISHFKGFTMSDAMLLLRKDSHDAALSVIQLDMPFTQTQLDALTSFAFNLGGGILHGQIGTALKAHKYQEAMHELQGYVHAGGVVLQGLVRRRAAEAHLFLTGAYQ